MATGKIKKVAGPLVIAEGMRDANMFDVVRVSDSRLIGEIIEMHGDQASVQVYEETSGLAPGAPVESTGMPLSVELGPGLISSIYDGIQRPLDDIMKICGNNLMRGVEVPSLKRDIKWTFVPTANASVAVIDLFMSAESQNYNAKIVGATCDSCPGISFSDNRISGLAFAENVPIRIKVQLDYHDYCSMEVKAYGNKYA